MKKIFTLALLLLIPTGFAFAEQRIASASAVVMRAAPTVQSGELLRLKLGTVVDVVSRSRSKAKIGSMSDHWYRVKASGKTGWIFGGLLRAFDPGRASALRIGIARERIQRQSKSFLEWTELVEFCGAAVGQTDDRDERAELELCRLRAAQKACNAKREDPWFAANKDTLYYHELAGQWSVRPDRMWAVHKRYKNTQLAEQIAYEASQAMTGGECEGFLECSMGRWLMTDGRYLELYPAGRHVAVILNRLDESLPYYLNQEIQDEPGVANKNIDAAIKVVSKTKNADVLRERVIDKLKKVREKHEK